MKDSIYVNRSVSACLKEATTMAFSNLKTILFNTWLPLLLVSISFTGILLSFTPNKQIYDLGNANIWLSLLFLVAMYILLFVSWLWTAAKAFAIVNGEKTKNNLKRCIAPIIVLVAFSLAVKSCLTGTIYETVNKWLTTFSMSEQATSGLALILLISVIAIVAALLLPLLYAFTHCILEQKESLASAFKSGYKTGIRHWGFLFLSTMITTLIVGVLAAIIMTPLTIILFANIQNTLGIINGDMDGTPSCFYFMLITTSIVCCFITTFISLWQLLSTCYVCGSITVHETEKNRQAKEINQHETTENLIY